VNWTAIASVLLALGVMLGAFGAHALRSRLDAYLLGIYERAVFYHFIHALGMLIVSVLHKAGLLPVNSMAWACGLLDVGVLFFSGSLYALAMTGARAFGPITPIGGLSFIAGWLFLAYVLVRNTTR